MAGTSNVVKASAYIDEVTKLPETIDFKGALATIKKFSYTYFEVCGSKIENDCFSSGFKQ